MVEYGWQNTHAIQCNPLDKLWKKKIVNSLKNGDCLFIDNNKFRLLDEIISLHLIKNESGVQKSKHPKKNTQRMYFILTENYRLNQTKS